MLASVASILPLCWPYVHLCWPWKCSPPWRWGRGPPTRSAAGAAALYTDLGRCPAPGFKGYTAHAADPEVGREGNGEVGLTWNNSDVRNNETSAGIAEKKRYVPEQSKRNKIQPLKHGNDGRAPSKHANASRIRAQAVQIEASKTAEPDLRSSLKETRSSH